MAAPLSPDDIAALESLVDWWDGAGVEALPTLPEETRPRRAAPQRRQPPGEQIRKATPAAAQAAGYGAVSEQDGREMAAESHGDADGVRPRKS